MQTFRRNTLSRAEIQTLFVLSPCKTETQMLCITERNSECEIIIPSHEMAGPWKVPLFSVLPSTPQPTSLLSAVNLQPSSPLRFVAVSCEKNRKALRWNQMKSSWLTDRVPVKVLTSLFPRSKKMSFNKRCLKLFGGNMPLSVFKLFSMSFSPRCGNEV